MKGLITYTTLIIIFAITSSFSYFHEEPIIEDSIEDVSAIQWLTFEQAIELHKIDKKKIFVDIYTQNCGWCAKMDRTTLNDPLIASYINDNFYPVKMDAGNTDPVEVNGKTYNYVKNNKGGYHELAALLTNGRLSSPTFVFIDENLNVIQPIAGYKNSEEFEIIMTYFGGDYHRKVPWVSYKKRYNDLPSKPQPTYIKN